MSIWQGRLRGLALWPALALGAVAALYAATTAAGAGVQLQALSSGAAHDALFAIDFDAARGIAVGTGGQVRISEDAGRSWRVEAIETQGLALLGVSTYAGRDLAAGQLGLMMRRLPQGDWQRVATGTTQRLFGVAQGPGELALAVGAFGELLRSTDGGARWSPVALDWPALLGESVQPHLYDVAIAADGAALVVGEFGLILRSDDAGATWRMMHKGDASLFGIDLRRGGRAFAVGQSGTVLRSDDAGYSWTPVAVDTRELLLSVSSNARDEVVIAGMREVLRSDDDGKHWHRIAEGGLGPAWYAGVATPGEQGHARLVGQAARVVRVGP